MLINGNYNNLNLYRLKNNELRYGYHEDETLYVRILTKNKRILITELTEISPPRVFSKFFKDEFSMSMLRSYEKELNGNKQYPIEKYVKYLDKHLYQREHSCECIIFKFLQISNKKIQTTYDYSNFLAERTGFEPAEAFTSHAFQACTLDHSDTSPEPRLFIMRTAEFFSYILILIKAIAFYSSKSKRILSHYKKFYKFFML